MRFVWLVAAAAAIAFPGAAGSQEQNERGRDWRLLGFSMDGEAAYFIDAASISDGSEGTEFDVLTDHRPLQETPEGSYDREILSYSVDCESRTFMLMNHVYSTDGLSGPPAIIRVYREPAPAAGTLQDVQIRAACGLQALGSESFRDPSDIWRRESR
jgi:surface-adhesin protein E